MLERPYRVDVDGDEILVRLDASLMSREESRNCSTISFSRRFDGKLRSRKTRSRCWPMR
jgi:hypothetical protein